MKDDFDKISPHVHNLRQQFMTAAEHGAVDIARDLLYQGVLDGDTLDRALCAAAREGQAGFVDFLVNEVNMDLSRKGAEALTQAVRERELKVAEVLTRREDIPLNPRSAMDTHYLDLALVGNAYSPELLQLLLDRGAKPIQAGFDALNTAIREDNGDALRRFMKLDPAIARLSGSKLDAAAMRLDPGAVSLLLRNGAPAGYDDNAPLRHVAQLLKDLPGRDPARMFDCAELLLEAGAADDDAEQEFMKAAVRHNNAPLVRRLLDRGVDVEPAMRGVGYNRMVLAATFGWEDIVERLHKEGATPPQAYEEALAAAAEHGHARLVDKLLDYGTDTTQTDVVFCAAVGGQVQLVKDLVSRGFTTDFTCKTLLEAVVEGNHGAMLDFLFDQGADRQRAHELYVRASNRDSKPYAAVHATIKQWSERGETVIRAIPELHALADLRQVEKDYRGKPETLLVRLSKINRIGDAVALARAARNDRLDVGDLLATDGAGNTVIEILGSRGQLPQLFAPDLWEERQQDFATLYAEVAPVYREQVDYQGLVSTWRRKALSDIRSKVPRLKKG
jgi:hypothetical protein